MWKLTVIIAVFSLIEYVKCGEKNFQNVVAKSRKSNSILAYSRPSSIKHKRCHKRMDKRRNQRYPRHGNDKRKRYFL